jgi:hypothetical protein
MVRQPMTLIQRIDEAARLAVAIHLQSLKHDCERAIVREAEPRVCKAEPYLPQAEPSVPEAEPSVTPALPATPAPVSWSDPALAAASPRRTRMPRLFAGMSRRGRASVLSRGGANSRLRERS